MTPDTPSRRATKRVTNPLPAPTKCPYCESKVSWVNNSEIYNGASFGEWPFAYRCSSNGCGAYVGMHQFTNIPLGTLANEKLRTKRKQAKELFQPLWQGFHAVPYTRKQAYRLLAEKMGIPWEECHFGWFSEEQADLAKEVCAKWVTSLSTILPKSVVSKAQNSLDKA